MADPHVREIGRVTDHDGDQITVGIDGGTVTIGHPEIAIPYWQGTVEQADEVAALLITALWQAAAQGGGSHG